MANHCDWRMTKTTYKRLSQHHPSNMRRASTVSMEKVILKVACPGRLFERKATVQVLGTRSACACCGKVIARATASGQSAQAVLVDWRSRLCGPSSEVNPLHEDHRARLNSQTAGLAIYMVALWPSRRCPNGARARRNGQGASDLPGR